MVALKGADIDRFVARPDPARPIVLVFGPDAGLVARARGGARARLGRRPERPLSARAPRRRTISPASPRALIEEVNTIPLFGGPARRVGEIGRSKSCAGGGTACFSSPHRTAGS
jgi:DNA polymerase-3 subunit delta